MIVLDTNVISELMRPAPNRQVVDWVNAQPATSLYLTSITQAEILHGVLLLPKGKRREAIAAAAAEVFAQDFRSRILSFDGAAAVLYANIVVHRRRLGQPVSAFDAQIAAVARSNSAELATRNTDDFVGCGVALINPWSA